MLLGLSTSIRISELTLRLSFTPDDEYWVYNEVLDSLTEPEGDELTEDACGKCRFGSGKAGPLTLRGCCRLLLEGPPSAEGGSLTVTFSPTMLFDAFR